MEQSRYNQTGRGTFDMKPELIPLYSAIISAAIALVVSWFSSRRTLRLEVDKLRLSTEQLAFSKLLEVRIREYPALYSMLSDLLKAIQGEVTAVDFEQLLTRVNEWDSRCAIFLGPETSNICFSFRAMLRANASAISALTTAAALPTQARHTGTSQRSGRSVQGTTAELRKAAERLELALRTDIGIHGIGMFGSDLSPNQRETY